MSLSDTTQRVVSGGDERRMRSKNFWAATSIAALQECISAAEDASVQTPFSFLALEEETSERKIYRQCLKATADLAETIEKCKANIRADNSFEYNFLSSGPEDLLSCSDGSFLVPNILNKHQAQSEYFDELTLEKLVSESGEMLEWRHCFPLEVRGTKDLTCAADGMPHDAKTSQPFSLSRAQFTREWDIRLSSGHRSLVIKKGKGCEGLRFPKLLLSLRNKEGVSRFFQDTSRPQFTAIAENGEFRQCLVATDDLGQTLKQCNSVLAGAESYQYKVPVRSRKIVRCPSPNRYLLPGILHHDDKQKEYYNSVTLSNFKFRDIVVGTRPGLKDVAQNLSGLCAPLIADTTQGMVCEYPRSEKILDAVALEVGGELASVRAPSTHTSVLIEAHSTCPQLGGANFPDAILTFAGNKQYLDEDGRVLEVRKTTTGSLAAPKYIQLGSLFGASSASIFITAATIAFY